MISYFNLYLIFSNSLYVWETWLDYRQYRLLGQELKKQKSSTTPSITTTTTTTATATASSEKRSLEYSLEKLRFSFVSSFYSHVLAMLFITLGGLQLFWQTAGWLQAAAARSLLSTIISFHPKTSQGMVQIEILQSLIFMSLIMITNLICQLPISLYSTFYIEQKYGFNQMTAGLYATDMLKSLMLFFAIGWPFMGSFLWLILYFGRDAFFFWLWLFVLCFQLLALTVYPTFIQPLFNKKTRIPSDDPLYIGLEKLAHSVGFPLSSIYVMDGSKRSNHSNAYYYGFFHTKHIVVFDTLRNQCTNEEIVAILGHELGHWWHRHPLQLLLVSQLHLFLFFYCFNWSLQLESTLYSDFGFSSLAGHGSTLIVLILFQFLYLPIESLLGFLMNALSRRFEYQADRYATLQLGFGQSLILGLRKLQEKNLGTNVTDPLYSAYHHSHPPVPMRIATIEALTKAQKEKTKKKDE